MPTHPHHRKHIAAMIHKHADEACGETGRFRPQANRAQRNLDAARAHHATLCHMIAAEGDTRSRHLLERAEVVAARRIAAAERVVALLSKEATA
jgi:hypothetical protein